MSKGLELLKAYEDKYTFASQFNGDKLPNYQTRKMLEPIEKELKAFDIVLSKVQLGGFIDSLQKTKNYEEYKNTYITLLTEEEYDLLKEVLINESNNDDR